MHKQLKDLLGKARGVSEFVLALNIDIRDFSSFSLAVESSQTAVFLSKIYKVILSNYFPNTAFFKPTGDGLLIIIPYAENNLKEVAKDSIEKSLKLLVDFGSLCSKDPMVNFDVPRKVGIGLARGAVTRIVSKNKTLDYSGRALNLASRLMDLARPSGIVFDSNFNIDLLPEEITKLFVKESVFIKGIAQKDPIEIYYTKAYTTISAYNKNSFEENKWKIDKDKKTLREIRDLGPQFRYNLFSNPLDKDRIKIKVTHPLIIKGKKRGRFSTNIDFPNFEYYSEAGKNFVRVDFAALAKRLEEKGIKDSWEIDIEIIYQAK